MRRPVVVVLAVAIAALAASASRVHAAPAQARKDAPTLSRISAVFDEGAKATYYTATLTPPGSAGIVGSPKFAWSLVPPPDDPGCKKFSQMPGKAGESVWYHAQEDGCSHLSFMHNGTVSVQVTVTLSNDNRPWVCNASYFGTLTGQGSDESLCTIEAPATHAVARPPVNQKEQMQILADLFDECAEAETAIAAVSAAAALPTGGVSAVPGVVAGGAAVGCTILARVAKRKVADPPDRNFLVIPTARATAVPQLVVSGNMPYLVAAAFNALSDNITATEGYTDAFVTSINRASGAHAAGNAKAQSAQELAAMIDAEAIAKLDDQRPAMRAALRDALTSAGVHVSYTVAQLRAAQQKSLPASLISALSQSKFPAAIIAQLHAQLKKAKLTAASFPADVASAEVVKADRQDAAVMRAYVAFVQKTR